MSYYLQIKEILLQLTEDEIENIKTKLSIIESIINEESKIILNRVDSQKILYIIRYDHIGEIEILEENHLEKLFKEISIVYFDLIFQFCGINIMTLLELDNCYHLILFYNFETKQINTLLDEFDSNELTLIFKYLIPFYVIRLLQEFNQNDRKLLIQDLSWNHGENIKFINDGIKSKKRRELFELLNLEEKIKFLELKIQYKRILIQSYNSIQIKLILSQLNIDELEKISRLNDKNRRLIIKHHSIKSILSKCEILDDPEQKKIEDILNIN